MHPAYSVILFTTASGAGYGLWFWLGLRIATSGATMSLAHDLVTLILGGFLVTLGLLSSTLHLGRPERAWRAFSQWPTSWLSREGVAAVATFVPAALLFLALFLPGGGLAPVAAILLVIGAVGTVWCTGMIYASLRTVPEWHHGLVPVAYLVLAAATGALLLATIDALFGRLLPGTLVLTAVSLLAAAVIKSAYWTRIDAADAPYTMAQAIGVPGASAIAPLDPPHTQPNFVMREMGYAVARRHARRLRLWALGLGFAVPLGTVALAAVLPALAAAFLLPGVVSGAVGIWAERWLFFAEAKHLSMLYYTGDAAGAEAHGS